MLAIGEHEEVSFYVVWLDSTRYKGGKFGTLERRVRSVLSYLGCLFSVSLLRLAFLTRY